MSKLGNAVDAADAGGLFPSARKFLGLARYTIITYRVIDTLVYEYLGRVVDTRLYEYLGRLVDTRL